MIPQEPNAIKASVDWIRYSVTKCIVWYHKEENKASSELLNLSEEWEEENK